MADRIQFKFNVVKGAPKLDVWIKEGWLNWKTSEYKTTPKLYDIRRPSSSQNITIGARVDNSDLPEEQWKTKISVGPENKDITIDFDWPTKTFKFTEGKIIIPEVVSKLIITSNPSNAKVYLNKVEKGKTPFDEKVNPGAYAIDLKLEGYKLFQAQRTVDENETETLHWDFQEEEIEELPPIIIGSEPEPETKPEPEPEKTWWEKFQDKVSSIKEYLNYNFYDKFQNSFKTITGVKLTEANWINWTDFILEHISPINAINKLLYGENLKGEKEKFGTAEDWLDVAILGVGFIIPGNVDDVGLKIVTKEITSSEAARLTEKVGTKSVASNLLKIVQKNPESSAKLLSKFPAPVRNAVIAGLGKSSYGREVIYTLGKTGYFKYTQSIWKKAMGTIFKFGVIAAGITLPIFAITEIPNYFNMRGFLRKQNLQSEGNWPSDIAFKLGEHESLMSDYTYKIESELKAERVGNARSYFELLKPAIVNYRDYVNSKQNEMLPEDYELSIDLLQFYDKYISITEEKIKNMEEEQESEEYVPPEEEEKPMGRITIISNPPGAKIYINGEYQFTETPFTKEMESGTHIIRLELEGYFIKETNVKWENGIDKEKVITLVAEVEEEAKNYKVSVSSTPAGAKIIINGFTAERNNKLLYTPDYVILKPGTYDFTVYKPGYKIPTAKRVVLENYG